MPPVFMLGLFIDPEDGGSIFLQTSLDFEWTTVLHPITLHNHCYEDLKSYITNTRLSQFSYYTG
jgi:hypothetical protein